MWIDDVSLSEFVRLAEPFVTPLQYRFRVDAETQELRWSLREPTAREIGDLLFYQQEISGDVFDAFDHESPGYFERRGVALGDRCRADVACETAAELPAPIAKALTSPYAWQRLNWSPPPSATRP